MPIASEIAAYYNYGLEQGRLLQGVGQLERLRTQALLTRFLPPPPAVIYDVGGGAGIYALWLAQRGYTVHLVDAMPLHVEQARQASQAQADHPLASAEVGDARRLSFRDESADAVLLLGPLYHLVERADRVQAWREAARVLRPGGPALGATITRFASTIYGLFSGKLDDPAFAPIAQRDLIDGQHRNPTAEHGYFTTAYFHHPDEIRQEIEASGLHHEATLAIEGPAALLPVERLQLELDHPARQERLLATTQALEGEPSLLGVSPHVMGVGRR